MSLFHPTNLVCPACKALVTMEAVGSVNADRRPDYRDDILADRFQDTTCPQCGESFRLQPNFSYLDAGRGQWIAGLPAGRLRDWVATEDEVAELFETSYGARAPKAAQAVGEGLEVRLTFGWPAIREKIYAREAGLDDTVLEMLKLDLMRRLPSAPLAEGVELRLFRVEGDRLGFIWISSETETPVQEIEVGREIYDAIAGDAAAWEGVRAGLADGPFVDMQKLFIGEGRAR
jgi:CpXC protein